MCGRTSLTAHSEHERFAFAIGLHLHACSVCWLPLSPAYGTAVAREFDRVWLGLLCEYVWVCTCLCMCFCLCVYVCV